MNLLPAIDRRTLLIGGGVGIGLVAAFALWPRRMATHLSASPAESAFGSYIKIARDGRITVAIPQVETGQGIWTALPQVVADELGAAWENIAVEPAPLLGIYANPMATTEGWLDGLGQFRRIFLDEALLQVTAGSTSIRAFERPMREAAAIVRSMLVGAAADRWNVDDGDCEVADGMVLNGVRTFSFGELAEEAAERSPPSQPELRRGGKSRLVGQPLPRLDGPGKATGSLRFAGDVRLPQMLYASARLAPPGGRLTAFSRAAAERSIGVRAVIAEENRLTVVADTWWAAEQALRAANAHFEAPVQSIRESRPLFEERLAAGELAEHFATGDYQSLVRGSRPLTATYWAAPSQHLGLETISATARLSNGHLEVWAPTQAPGAARRDAGKAAGNSAERVTLYPMPVGEPSGRALQAEAVPLAVALTRRMRRPVQLTLSQPATQNHDRPSGGALGRMHALPGAGGITSAWNMQLVAGGGFGATLDRLVGAPAPDDLTGVDLGGAIPPYAIPNISIEAARPNLPFEAAYMRGSPQREMCFFIESFIDELSRAAGMEPLSFRMSMLGGNGRLARCLQAAARLAKWDGGAAGSTMGIAGCTAFGSHIGLVAVASVGDGQQVKVHRLIAAVDCGRVINTGLVRQQVEGGLIWALGQARVAQPEWVAGMPRARPFGGIALPRIGDIPDIMVQIIPSDEAPGGVSGLGTTVLAPAVANAVFAGTGRRLRSVPFEMAAAA